MKKSWSSGSVQMLCLKFCQTFSAPRHSRKLTQNWYVPRDQLFNQRPPKRLLQAELPNISSRLSTQVRNILASRYAERGEVSLPFFIARQNMDGSELEFSDMLAEDQNCGAMSYIDCKNISSFRTIWLLIYLFSQTYVQFISKSTSR